MNDDLRILYFTAASLGVIHTLVGPDHYLSFVVMAKARNWPLAKTSLITLACGLGHIMGSVLLGFIGIVFGIGVMKIEAFESFRGNVAAWALIGFGFAYAMWGIRKAVRYKPHEHAHMHLEDNEHAHEHIHVGRHAHAHGAKNISITPWILFTIFVLGPCEPLIPILMYPAAKNSPIGVIMASCVFGISTIATMLLMVILMTLGMSLVPLGRLERFSHALAGAAILLSGLAIQLLGL